MLTQKELSNGNQARKINGVWYEFILSPIEARHIIQGRVVVNDLFGVRGTVESFIAYYGRKVYARDKRRLQDVTEVERD